MAHQVLPYGPQVISTEAAYSAFLRAHLSGYCTEFCSEPPQIILLSKWTDILNIK